MVASQHPLRFGLSQTPAQQFLLLGFFITRLLNQALIRFAHFIDSYSCSIKQACFASFESIACFAASQ
jgi:hypothetical protein